MAWCACTSSVLHAHTGMHRRRPAVHVGCLSMVAFHFCSLQQGLALNLGLIHSLARELLGSVCGISGTNTPGFFCEFWASELRSSHLCSRHYDLSLCCLLYGSSMHRTQDTHVCHQSHWSHLPASELPTRYMEHFFCFLAPWSLYQLHLKHIVLHKWCMLLLQFFLLPFCITCH